MYPMIPQTNNNNQQGNPYYQFPYLQQYQRLAQLEQQQNNMPTQLMSSQISQNQNFLKGRPVVSIEEARAAQIDLDGSLFIFTDIGNKKIYTKQINLDGTASLNTYSLVENATPNESFVTRAELNNAMALIEEKIVNQRKEKTNEPIKQSESRSAKTTVCSKPSF